MIVAMTQLKQKQHAVVSEASVIEQAAKYNKSSLFRLGEVDNR